MNKKNKQDKLNLLVKYNNDFNYIQMPNFKGSQMDLFFAILACIRDKHAENSPIKRFFDPNYRKLNISYKDFVDICKINAWNREFKEIYYEIDEFFKILLSFQMSYTTKDKKNHYRFVCFECAQHDRIEQTIKITFQKQFYDIIVNYALGFTQFELEEFISISGKYSKTLYRLLKQFRSKGVAYFKWETFKSIMNIPENFKMSDIDKRILKPAIQELSEKNLFSQGRTIFSQLSYEKIKGKGRGRGGCVEAIQFTFKPESNDPKFMKQAEKSLQQIAYDKKAENVRKEAKAYAKRQEEEQFKPKFNPLTNEMTSEFASYINRNFKKYNPKTKQMDTLKILNIYRENNKVIMLYKNADDDFQTTMTFDSKKHFENVIQDYLI